MLIGIDGSTTATAFSFGGVNDGVPRGGVWKLPGCDEAVFDRTLAVVHDAVLNLAQLVKAEHVFIEAPLLLVDARHAASTAMALIQLTGAIRAAGARAGCRVTTCAVSTVRKHFIGAGNLKRAEAKRAVIDRCKLLGWPVTDGEGKDSDDRADACAVWAYGMALRYPSWVPKGTPLFAAAKGGAA